MPPGPFLAVPAVVALLVPEDGLLIHLLETHLLTLAVGVSTPVDMLLFEHCFHRIPNGR